MRAGVVARGDETTVSFSSSRWIESADRCPWARLEDGVIHVWGFTLDESYDSVETARQWLDTVELTRASRFVRQDDQVRYVLAHGCLRAVLGRYVALDPAAVKFHSAPTGKPCLSVTGEHHNPLKFSLSHSHGLVLIAVGKHREVGADLEQVRDEVDVVKLAERYYAPSERDSMVGLSGPERVQRFFRYWVAKESVLKGQGVGLQLLTQCEVLAADHHVRAEILVSKGSTMHPGWTVQWLSCGSGWEAAVAAQGNSWTIRAMNAE